MAFVPRYTKPDPNSDYYSTYNRFSWLNVAPYGGNCTGYAYGRSNEIAQRSLYNEFYITQSPGNASQWIYNSWPQYTHTSGTIDLHLGDILVWGGGRFGHVEIVEAISGTNVTCSGSVWGQTYGSSREFYTRTITYPPGDHTWVYGMTMMGIIIIIQILSSDIYITLMQDQDRLLRHRLLSLVSAFPLLLPL